MALAALLAPLYAGCYAAIKSGLVFAPPLRFAALRALMAGTVLLAITAILRQPLLPPRRFWAGVGALAISGTFFAFGAMFLSPGRTGAGIASVLGNTMPIIIIILAAVFLGEPVTRGKAAALILGFVGVSLIAYPAITDPSGPGLLSAVLPLTAATGFAFASVLIKRMGVGGALLSITAWQLIIGGALLLLVAEWLERGVAVAWTPTFISLLVFLAVLGTALTTTVWYWLVQQGDIGRLSLVLFLVPVLGLALAVALFGESVGILEAIGVVTTLAGIGAIVRESGRDPETGTRGASLRD